MKSDYYMFFPHKKIAFLPKKKLHTKPKWNINELHWNAKCYALISLKVICSKTPCPSPEQSPAFSTRGVSLAAEASPNLVPPNPPGVWSPASLQSDWHYSQCSCGRGWLLWGFLWSPGRHRALCSHTFSEDQTQGWSCPFFFPIRLGRLLPL